MRRVASSVSTQLFISFKGLLQRSLVAILPAGLAVTAATVLATTPATTFPLDGHRNAVGGLNVSEVKRVGLLELADNLGTVLGLHQTRREARDGFQHQVPQLVVLEDKQSLLKDVVAELIVSKALHEVSDTGRKVTGLISKLAHQGLVVHKVGALEDFFDLGGSLRSVEALLHHVR